MKYVGKRYSWWHNLKRVNVSAVNLSNAIPDHNLAISVPADALAPNGARPSTKIVMTEN